MFNPNSTLEECVDVARDLNLTFDEPGKSFFYHLNHMQVAGLMAELATGMQWGEIFKTEVADVVGVNQSEYVWWSENPLLGGGMQSSVDEYAVMLRYDAC